MQSVVKVPKSFIGCRMGIESPLSEPEFPLHLSVCKSAINAPVYFYCSKMFHNVHLITQFHALQILFVALVSCIKIKWLTNRMLVIKVSLINPSIWLHVKLMLKLVSCIVYILFM